MEFNSKQNITEISVCDVQRINDPSDDVDLVFCGYGFNFETSKRIQSDPIRYAEITSRVAKLESCVCAFDHLDGVS